MPGQQTVPIFIILAYNKYQEYLWNKKWKRITYTEPNFLYSNHLPLFMKEIILRCIDNKKFHSVSKAIKQQLPRPEQ